MKRARRVRLVHWNPMRPLRRWEPNAKPWSIARPNNFGDLLGPTVVRGLLADRGYVQRPGIFAPRLLSVGSVLHLARDGDTVWGTGVNGKTDHSAYRFSQLDVRAVRGPLTRRFLLSRGIDCPPVFGDPALLLPMLRPDLVGRAKRIEALWVPNLHDRGVNSKIPALDPTMDLESCLSTIAESEFVVASSLHGVVIAESLGIPARFVQPGTEDDFKYIDYLEATGRSDYRFARSIDEALSLGGAPAIDWDSSTLLKSFPWDLFELSHAMEATQ